MSTNPFDPNKLDTYHTYVNTMVFALVSGVVSVVLLLALMYVPAMSQYGVLIIVVQIGVILIILQALIRIWWSRRQRDSQKWISAKNKLAVGLCPDYMVASVVSGGGTNSDNGDGSGWGTGNNIADQIANNTTCWNTYDGTSNGMPVWVTQSNTPLSVTLKSYNDQYLDVVCSTGIGGVNAPSSNASLISQVPWTEVRSMCGSFGY